MEESLASIRQHLVDLDLDQCLASVRQALSTGVTSWDIVDNGLGVGMHEVGDLFETGEYFLGELMMAGNIMADAMDILKDTLDMSQRQQKGKVILATVKGDLHDLGKKMVGMMLESAGFEVIDLGVDVAAEKIVQTVKQTGARAVGLTMLLTPGVESMREVGHALDTAGLRDQVKIAIGGAATNQKLANDMNYEAYGENAAKAVRIFESLLESSKKEG